MASAETPRGEGSGTNYDKLTDSMKDTYSSGPLGSWGADKSAADKFFNLVSGYTDGKQEQMAKEEIYMEKHTSVIPAFTKSPVPKQVADLIERIIFTNNVCIIGDSNSQYYDFFKIANLASKLQTDQPLDIRRIKAIDLDELSQKDSLSIKRHLYDTRNAVYTPYISVCGKSFTTLRKFIEFVHQDKGATFCRYLQQCPTGDEEREYMSLPRGFDPSKIGMTGDAATFDAKAYIDGLIEKSKVVIFSTTRCPYCRVAQKQFDKLNQSTNKVELDLQVRSKILRPENFKSIMDDLTARTDQQCTVPKVFICGDYIGGGTETKQLFQSGKLQQLIDACSKSYD